MQEIFGDFIKIFPPKNNYLELNFAPHSERIEYRWRNRRLSAHFAADYFINFLPIDLKNPEQNEQRIKETKGAVSFVVNELLENAMKFNLENSTYMVKFGIHFLEDSEMTAVIFASNVIDLASAENFQTFIQKLLTSDPEMFYIEQIEASAEDENSDMSGLGFLTMINNYEAKLGWKFETISSELDIIEVTSMVQISV